ncbi:MAG: prepilin-type N-terminal cleavage/methylation domain-containing protein [Fimbriimonadaceae bacterium]|nr:prepilin-type N-terminal cleavage/methylation domain-containing protein [Fimbriimonadaceae bacterium]
MERIVQVRRAFTLIELLVVIAIIAILAAIMFPVFIKAKAAVFKLKGANQVKQMGMMSSLYSADYDEVLFPYRVTGRYGPDCIGDACINPDYQRDYKTHGTAAQAWYGGHARNAMFFHQFIAPYGEYDKLFRSPGQPRTWVGADKENVSSDVPEYRSYGGQNSYAVNWYLFTSPIATTYSGGGIPTAAIADPSDTFLYMDASYYNVLPRDPRPLAGNYYETWYVCTGNYPEYWKNIGNSSLFRPSGVKPTDEEAILNGRKRYDGQIVISRVDLSVKSFEYMSVLTSLRDKGAESQWDPYKQGTLDCP